MEKAITFCRCFFNSITPNKQWQMAFDHRDEFYHDPTWELLAKNNKLSMPSNNKIIINLKIREIPGQPPVMVIYGE